MKKMILALIVLSSVASPTFASPIVLNFDTDQNNNPLADGTLLNTAYPNLGVTFSASAQIFLSGGGVTSQPNFASSLNFTDPLTLTFDGTTDFVSAANVTNSIFTLTAFDENNNILGTSFVDSFGAIASVSAPGIAFVTFTTTSQFGIDDLTFNPVVALETAVPEPATLAVFGLMAAGGLGYVRRRTKAVAAPVA